VEVEQGERVTRHAVVWPGGELILSDDALLVGVVMATDAERAHDEVGERRRPFQTDVDVAVPTSGRLFRRPVLLAFHDAVFHQMRQQHDLQRQQPA